MWLRHEDGKFLILSHGSEWLQNFFSHINSHRLATEFIKNSMVTILCSSWTPYYPKSLFTKILVKFTNMRCYIHFESNHLLHVKDKSFMVCLEGYYHLL